MKKKLLALILALTLILGMAGACAESAAEPEVPAAPQGSRSVVPGQIKNSGSFMDHPKIRSFKGRGSVIYD